jgi:hypothetical protein
MADAGTRFPPLYITAWVLIGIGISGLLWLLILRPPAHLFSGVRYILMSLVLFGVGEIVNHPKTSMPATYPDDHPQKSNRQRNSCSLGNLCDIGAVLLFFAGLSTLLFPH